LDVVVSDSFVVIGAAAIRVGIAGESTGNGSNVDVNILASAASRVLPVVATNPSCRGSWRSECAEAWRLIVCSASADSAAAHRRCAACWYSMAAERNASEDVASTATVEAVVTADVRVLVVVVTLGVA
jgi:hypothetical protein